MFVLVSFDQVNASNQHILARDRAMDMVQLLWAIYRPSATFYHLKIRENICL